MQITPMHVNNARLLLEYEIDPSELDFTNSKNITKVLSNPFSVLVLCVLVGPVLNTSLCLSAFLLVSYMAISLDYQIFIVINL